MRHVRWASWTVAVAATVIAGAVQVARADVTSDKEAAIVVFPIINVEGPFASDTLIQLSNTDQNNPVAAHCFYLNANGHCTNDGSICATGAQCCSGNSCGLCLPGWNETDFRVYLTAKQPIAWQASNGLQSFCTATPSDEGEPCIPLNGTSLSLVSGQSNAGTRIPPVPEQPFIGELKCIVVDPTGTPWPAGTFPNNNPNVLVGEATLENAYRKQALTRLDVGKYNGIGIRALANPAGTNPPNEIVMAPAANGGDYEGCPNVLVLDHFFDSAVNPVSGVSPAREIFTWPVFVPCTENLLTQVPGSAVAQYLVYNEFEQRFSTSNTVQCFKATALSFTDTTQPQNSIFNAGVTGTLTGQTRVSPLGSGLLAVALEFHTTSTTTSPTDAIFYDSVANPTGLPGQQDDVNVHYQSSVRPSPDVITLPMP